ncbi:MAG: enoyl-CoA hydratase-related protein, partial [Hydrogenophaga sp.]|uniref:enoyl-CoA hydratase-related protein n=1 Tax=Hydrogenophaga sp. TaxID=1904254 RepID=UPI002AB8F824
MTATTCFSLSSTDNVAHLVMSRPAELNTMNPTFWRELDEVLTRLNNEGTARALVISSTGKHFSAGMSLETFAGAISMDDQSPEGRAAIFDLLTDMQATFTKLENLRIPVICAIQGGCIGGAVDMVTAACIRYATADAFFCIQEINIGMVA